MVPWASLFERSALRWLGCVLALACEPVPEQVVETGLPGTPPVIADLIAVAKPPAVVTEAATVAPSAAPKTPLQPQSLCNEQTPQPFLVRAHFDSYVAAGGTAREWKELLDKAVRYRTEQYGYVKGYGKKAWNASTPAEQTGLVTFFGLTVPLHRRIAPALACVEAGIRERCGDQPYQPYVLSGHRKRNTYVSGEISNHVYGIALDVDPLRNPCCGCIGGWEKSERCQNEKSKFQRMDMPRCWVTEFERFGFYWLGHDKIEDTMHFEFLADPGQIVRRP
ncbi:MAG: hypothetical protein K0R38_6341 [Polyangiaceae bacterium]|nr:hypothetical protein [Polyangiaceae bacterium]